jgi:serine carboxypeptidase-like clade I
MFYCRRHNIYNIYDNCARTKVFLDEHGLNMYQLQTALHHELDTGIAATTTLAEQLQKPSLVGAVSPSGGYPWACGGNDATKAYLSRADVMKVLHLQPAGQSTFKYHSSGPASITLHPELAKKLRVLIYNGDADACVPYKGNEEWIDGLVKAGDLAEAVAWKPWYNDVWPNMPAGYVTSYNVTGAPANDFTFLTIRLAGHMVPTFEPQSSLSFFTRFLRHQPF